MVYIALHELYALPLEVFSEGYCSTDELCKRRLRENAMVRYATRNLSNHIYGKTEHSPYDLVLRLSLENRKFQCASQVLFVDKTLRPPGYSQRLPRDFQGMRYAAHLGLKGPISIDEFHFRVDPDSKDSYGQTPLSWAAEKWDVPLVYNFSKLSKTKGADLRITFDDTFVKAKPINAVTR
jgi:hypothetical protein